VPAGPFEELDKAELPGQLCAFTAGVLRTEARHEPGYYDVVHSHYWLSGQVGWLARERWGVPLVHTAHTLGKVKNAALAEGEQLEPRLRLIGEQQVVDEADLLVSNTDVETNQLVDLYDAEPGKVETISPGVDIDTFTPGDTARARASLGIRPDDVVLAFVGRIQPLKAPDVLLRAAAELLQRHPELRERLVLLVVGGPSGSGLQRPRWVIEMAESLGISDVTRFLKPRSGDRLAQVYRAADVVAVPSYNESFGLVALEAQACGTPVVAASVGGLPVAVRDGASGLLVDGHEPHDWAARLAELALSPRRRSGMAMSALRHARSFSWDRTTDALLAGYAEAARVFRGRLLGTLNSEVAS
jgi:D-inositol-3-phosphate glycosyltransferase